MTRGWSKVEKKELMKIVRETKKEGKPIKSAFVAFGEKSGRKPESVRNFYYSYLASADYYPEGITKNEIVVFTQKETVRLVSKILRLCAAGKSVRGAISEITGDKKERLRFQNKFRSLVKAKSPIIFEEMEKQKKSLIYYNPFLKRVVEIERLPKTLVSDKTTVAANALSEYFDALEKEADKAARKEREKRA